MRPLARFLDRLDVEGRLPKTILYCMNPTDNAVLATLIGCFPAEGVRGKMQFGPAWWFNDQKDGMEEQLKTLASMGLLARFVGMLTDSRSFLSFPRHEYFRRILCAMLGDAGGTGESCPRLRPPGRHGRGHLLEQRGGVFRASSQGICAGKSTRLSGIAGGITPRGRVITAPGGGAIRA